MKRSKRKERKRREEYNKAIKHKMESAADLADKYSQIYDYSEKAEKEHRKSNNRVVKRKLIYSILNILIQSFALILIIFIVFLPFRKIFKSVVEKYFSAKKPTFTEVMVNDSFISSVNRSRNVEYADIERPENNACFAEIESRYINSKVYYGISEQAMIKGLCSDIKTSMPGFDKAILLKGYYGTHLEEIDKFKNGDKIDVATAYGVYTYEVIKFGSFGKNAEVPFNLDIKAEHLVICTDYNFNSEKTDYTEIYYIIAEKVSGPEIVY